MRPCPKIVAFPAKDTPDLSMNIIVILVFGVYIELKETPLATTEGILKNNCDPSFRHEELASNEYLNALPEHVAGVTGATKEAAQESGPYSVKPEVSRTTVNSASYNTQAACKRLLNCFMVKGSSVDAAG